jgi:ubiquinone/menaquinone biosynthesis C-methylase UbiE
LLKSVLSEGGLKALAYDVGPGRYYQPAYRNIASAINVESGAFLDVGCGPGWLSIYVAAGKPELDAIGIDTNEAMLQKAERHKGTRLNITYRSMDAADIIYPEGTFTAAAAVQSAHHWEDPAAVLSEVYRVLQPGCSFYIYEADAELDEVPEGWIQRQGPFPPDAWILRNWKKFGMDAAQWEELKQQIRASPFGGGEDGRHGFYRRLVLTRQK